MNMARAICGCPLYVCICCLCLCIQSMKSLKSLKVLKTSIFKMFISLKNETFSHHLNVETFWKGMFYMLRWRFEVLITGMGTQIETPNKRRNMFILCTYINEMHGMKWNENWRTAKRREIFHSFPFQMSTFWESFFLHSSSHILTYFNSF